MIGRIGVLMVINTMMVYMLVRLIWTILLVFLIGLILMSGKMFYYDYNFCIISIISGK